MPAPPREPSPHSVSHESDSDNDADAPRVMQWVDEDELEAEDITPEESEDEEVEEQVAEDAESLKTNLSSLPFGALQKAHRVLAQAKAYSDSEEDDREHDDDASDASGSEPEETVSRWSREEKGKAKEEKPPKSKKDITKRSSKHAPTEVTSKRPVSRRRIVVDMPKQEARDPRFLPLAGEFDAKKFSSQYGFIAEMHETELKTLRDNLKRARKLLASSPRDLREAREQEVHRLELAVKRAESLVNKDKRDRIEQEALGRAAKEEKEKQKQGKGRFWMKNGAKKELLLKARYEALAKEGGRGAVKKAIDKKQKKVAQKETKSRPYARGEAFGRTGSGEQHRDSAKRQGTWGDNPRESKRLKT